MKLVDAAEVLGLGRRQTRRLADRFQQFGIDGLKSRKIGKPARNRTPTALIKKVVEIIRADYSDFGPTLAAEKLAERHGIILSRETVRGIMSEHGIWTDRYARRPRNQQLREPRPQFGELIQIDGSHHDWFEGRRPKCCLIVFVDDATSKVVRLLFAETENALAYMEATQEYVADYGLPRAFYSDRHSIFYNSSANLARGDRLTQFGEVLQRLTIQMILADSSEAKGRVERSNRTLQDRLIKEMRLEGISDLVAANAFAERYRHTYNRKFGKPPLDPDDAHRPAPSPEELHRLVRWEETRKVTRQLAVTHNKVVYNLENSKDSQAAAGREILVSQHYDGTIELIFRGRSLPYSAFDKLRRIRQPDIVSSKRLDAALEAGRRIQDENPHQVKRNNSALAKFTSPVFYDHADDRTAPDEPKRVPEASASRRDDRVLPEIPVEPFDLERLKQIEATLRKLKIMGAEVPPAAPRSPAPSKGGTDMVWPLEAPSERKALSEPIPSIYESRKVSAQRSFSYRGIRYVLEETELSLCTIGEFVVVVPREGERVEAIWAGESLPIESWAPTSPKSDKKKAARMAWMAENKERRLRSDIRSEPEDKSPPSQWPPSEAKRPS